MNHIEELLKRRGLIRDSLFTDENFEFIHYFTQALRAHKLYAQDVDYVVQDGKVQIVDEFTGRILYGRRYSEGLHQAIEAKERIKIAAAEPHPRHDHLPELLPHVRQARRHDGNGGHRGAGVRQDLQPRGRRHPDQPARSPARTTTTRST